MGACLAGCGKCKWSADGVHDYDNAAGWLVGGWHGLDKGERYGRRDGGICIRHVLLCLVMVYKGVFPVFFPPTTGVFGRPRHAPALGVFCVIVCLFVRSFFF